MLVIIALELITAAAVIVHVAKGTESLEGFGHGVKYHLRTIGLSDKFVTTCEGGFEMRLYSVIF